MTILPVHKNTKKSDKPLLKQILELIPRHLLLDSIRQNQSDKGCSAYKTYDQLVAMTFGQLKLLFLVETLCLAYTAKGLQKPVPSLRRE